MTTLPGSRTLHVVATAQHRGAERFALQLAGEMSAAGGRAAVAALTPGGAPPYLGVPTLGRLPRHPTTLLALRRAARANDVVVAHGSSTLAACALALPGGPPFVYRSIGDPAYWAPSGARRTRMAAFLRRASAIVAMWPEAVDALAHLAGPRTPVQLIRKGIRTDVDPVGESERRVARERWGLPVSGPVVAFLGALSPEKDPLAAVAAVSALPDAHLLVIGGGPMHREVSAAGQRLLPGRHRLTGPLAEPRQALAAADVLVLTSHTEGVPSAPLEAALLGIPSVVTGVGGAPSTVVDGGGGRVVAAGDLEAMAAAVGEVLEKAAEHGRVARSHVVAEFDLVRTARQWTALCNEVSAGSRRPVH